MINHKQHCLVDESRGKGNFEGMLAHAPGYKADVAMQCDGES